MRALIASVAFALAACGQTSAITDHFTAEARPKRLPPQPFQQIGANAVLRWKEWKARAE